MRLIDIEAEVCADCVWRDKCDSQAYCWVKEMQTVDAVPVVHCKDCKHRIYKRVNDWIGKIGGCGIFDYPMPDDFFCSYGERKEGANNG